MAKKTTDRVFDVVVQVRVIVHANDPKGATHAALDAVRGVDGMSRITVMESFEPASGYTFNAAGIQQE